jgi:hypothetical protein
MLFLHILTCCVLFVHLMKLLCTKFKGTNPSYMCAKNKVCRSSWFLEEEVWSKSWWQHIHVHIREAMT